MHLRTNIIRNIFVLALVIGACTSCDNDFMQVEAPKTTGVLRLQMSSNQHYIDIETRASVPLTSWDGYTITLKQGDKAIDATFDNGVAILEAGTYTLSATNAASVDNGYSGPLYSGSESVTIEVGKQTDVTLDLGKPKNAKVTLIASKDFTDLYTISSFKIGDVELNTNDAFYFPVTETPLTYTLVADAKSGSHVQDITSATGTITISAGTHTPITLKINPIDDSLVMIETGTEYGGVFQQLINVARASIKELKEDYEDYLTTRNLCKWDDQHPRFAPMLDFCRQHNNQADYSSMYYKASDEELANLALPSADRWTR